MEREYYEQYWSPAGFNPRGSTNEWMVARLRGYVRPGMRCLDVGCGDGRTAGVWLRDQQCSYVGVDISASAVSQAKNIGLDARLIRDASELPFDNESFDLIIAIEVLEHLFLPQLAAAEIRRILAPGGQFFCTVPNVVYWRRRLDLLAGRWNPFGDSLSVAQPWRDPHIRFFTPSTLRGMLDAAGFIDVQLRGHGGALLRDLPVARKLGRGSASFPYRMAQRVAPAFFGLRLDALARVAPPRGRGLSRGATQRVSPQVE